MIKIGITGSIGSGKSTVIKLFEDLGIPVYNSDRESKKFLSKNKIKKQIVEQFGLQIVNIDGEIDKSILAEIVFSDKSKLKLLENILFPLVIEDFENWCKTKFEFEYILHESAIIYESGMSDMFDKIIVITAPDEVRMNRVVNRDKCSVEDFYKRDNLQIPQSEKVKLADFEIVNNGDINDLILQVEKLNKLLLDFSI